MDFARYKYKSFRFLNMRSEDILQVGRLGLIMKSWFKQQFEKSPAVPSTKFPFEIVTYHKNYNKRN